MIIFRADGNNKIGAGHIMRCLSIANAAKEAGEDCLFIIASGEFRDVITKNGHRVVVLDSDYMNMKPEELISYIDSEKPSAVIADSYYITEEYMHIIHECAEKNASKLIYIDDRCNIACDCDVLVNYNVSADLEEYRKLFEGKRVPLFLIGTEFAPLRKEFQSREQRVVSRDARDILVSTGGSDPEHFALVLVNAAKRHIDHFFHFVLGMMNPDKEAIRDSALDQSNIIIHENVSEMGKLMRECDVAISASGSTLYELCATQTPAITYVLADNQIPLAKAFDKQGIIRNIGDIRILGKEILADSLISAAVEMAKDYQQRKDLSLAMSSVVDGNGAKRIIENFMR